MNAGATINAFEADLDNRKVASAHALSSHLLLPPYLFALLRATLTLLSKSKRSRQPIAETKNGNLNGLRVSEL